MHRHNVLKQTSENKSRETLTQHSFWSTQYG